MGAERGANMPGVLCVGCKAPLKRAVPGEAVKRTAEIVSLRKTGNSIEYYVHYKGFNKRLDEWIGEDLLDLSNEEAVEYPKKKKQPGKGKKDEKKDRKEGTESILLQKLPLEEELAAEDAYKVKNIHSVEMGGCTVNAWYFSPYPPSLARKKHVLVCEYCLFYFAAPGQLERHRGSVCKLNRPPGVQIYRKEGLSFFELDGQAHSNYCRNLSLLSKLFLDHKTLYYDVDVFLFYVMCVYDPETPEEEREYKIVGYFSKEKESQHGYNVACILILPQYQRRGYGRILIDFSYLLSKRERVAASPEKPLSDLGLLSYRQYWVEKITDILVRAKSISINAIKDVSSITTEDIVHTLRTHNMLMFYKGTPAFILKEEVLRKHEKSHRAPKLDPAFLIWDPPYQH